MVDTLMGREKKMSSTIRIERIADRLAAFGRRIFDSFESTSTMTPQDTVREANIATIADWSNNLDDITIANVCDASIDVLSDGYPLIAVYQASPRPETLTVVGDVVTVEIELTVQFADHPSVTVDALLTGNISGRSPGLTSLSRIDRQAA